LNALRRAGTLTGEYKQRIKEIEMHFNNEQGNERFSENVVRVSASPDDRTKVVKSE
jgi:hypothetical protein